MTACVWECSCLLAQDNTVRQYHQVGFWAQWEMLCFGSAVSLSGCERAAERDMTEHSYYQTELNRTESSKVVPRPENFSLVQFHPSCLGHKGTLISHRINLLFSLMSATLFERSPNKTRIKHWMYHGKQKYFFSSWFWPCELNYDVCFPLPSTANT